VILCAFDCFTLLSFRSAAFFSAAALLGFIVTASLRIVLLPACPTRLHVVPVIPPRSREQHTAARAPA
jgi:hypothetical protein